MSFRYLLDTNMISELAREPRGPVARKIADVGDELVCTSTIVSSEIRFGARKSRSETLRVQLDRLLSTLEILPFDIPADHHYAEIRRHLETAGTPIGPNDMLIGAQARSLRLTVVSAHERVFQRIPDLCVENWLNN